MIRRNQGIRAPLTHKSKYKTRQERRKLRDCEGRKHPKNEVAVAVSNAFNVSSKMRLKIDQWI